MLWSALVFGLLGSFHCVGMCGPIAFMLPVDRENKFKKLLQIFLYHFGRICAYSIIGLLFGLIGKSLNIFGLQQQLSVLVGVLMILVVLIPTRVFNRYNFSRPIYKGVSKIKNALGKELKKKSPDTFLTIGFLNGFLPCGLVYMAVFGSLAAVSAWKGSLYMALFGIGTIPLMTAAVYLGNFLNTQIRQRIRQAVPVFALLIGCLFILRGLGLGIPYISPKSIEQEVTTSYECHSVSDESKLNN
ncbi:sulfite exporter TauE/SafE family protein [Ulvibacter antarcticus]|uniref:Urease accessory protein UreH-like transmembrane domain-containing protein n=1 Tax=Ulvibacter antarcticus TaxID=442714 RepID=A0A3L9YDE8_9FLAO|nr:sulfite exporter TauE/SafE family protein [Ulvibacter antarcticus]RMA58726.1 hypothetical protein BXY75_2103 [Ulvibacter antarcticus]